MTVPLFFSILTHLLAGFFGLLIGILLAWCYESKSLDRQQEDLDKIEKGNGLRSD
jgi:hypothetical protein